jgi:hypothetical protein
MKKKLIFAIATGLFAVATVFNMNILQANSVGNVSLEGIAVMARALPENIDQLFDLCTREDNKRCSLGNGWYAEDFRNK